MALTIEEQKYYDDMVTMFATDGWRSLIEEAKKQIYQFQAEALESDSWDRVCFLRGQAEQLARLINLPDLLDTLRKTAEADAADESNWDFEIK